MRATKWRPEVETLVIFFKKIYHLLLFNYWRKVKLFRHNSVSCCLFLHILLRYIGTRCASIWQSSTELFWPRSNTRGEQLRNIATDKARQILVLLYCWVLYGFESLHWFSRAPLMPMGAIPQHCTTTKRKSAKNAQWLGLWAWTFNFFQNYRSNNPLLLYSVD